MKRFLIIFIIYCSLLTANCFTQSITWQRLYDIPGGNVSYSKATCHADNGNFYSGGTAFINGDWDIYIIKLNPYGDTIWTRIIDTLATDVYAMAPTGDGGCIITGDNHYTIKLSSTGSIVWAKYYGGVGIQLYDIIKTSDGGYIACGEFFDVNNFTHNGYLMKLDVNGNFQWQQIYMTNDFKIMNSIIELQDGIYIVTGGVHDYSGDTLRAFLWKLNSIGNVVWQKKYMANNRICSGYEVNKTNNTYLIFGQTVDSTGTKANTFFSTVDTSGNLIHTKIYEANRNEEFDDMKIISSNKYIFTRTRSLGSNRADSYVMIIDSLGNTFNEKSFALEEVVSFRSILIMSNGDFVFAGDGRPVLSSPWKTYIVRTDSNLYAPPIGINSNSNNIPAEYILYQNYPNPFNPTTTIEFQLRKAGNIVIKVFDLLGREVETLVNEKLPAGSYETRWDATGFGSGIYLVTLIAGGLKFSKKMVLIK